MADDEMIIGVRIDESAAQSQLAKLAAGALKHGQEAKRNFGKGWTAQKAEGIGDSRKDQLGEMVFGKNMLPEMSQLGSMLGKKTMVMFAGAMAMEAATLGKDTVINLSKHMMSAVPQAFMDLGKMAANAFMSGLEALRSGDPSQYLSVITDAMTELTKQIGTFTAGALRQLPVVGEVWGGAIEKIAQAMAMGIDVGGAYMSHLMEIGDQFQQVSRQMAQHETNMQYVMNNTAMVANIMGSGAIDTLNDVAEGISRFGNTLELAGPQLQEFTQNYGAFAEVVANVNEVNIAGVMKAFEVPQKDMNKMLTRIGNIMRETGGEADRVITAVINSGPAFRALGYDVDTTAYMFGKMTQEGERGTRMMYALNQVVEKTGDMAGPGKLFDTAQQGWEFVVQSVKTATNEAKAFDRQAAAAQEAGNRAEAERLELAARGKRDQARKMFESFTTPMAATLLTEAVERDIIKVSASLKELLDTNPQIFDTSLSDAATQTTNLAAVFLNLQQIWEAGVGRMGLALNKSLAEPLWELTRWMSDNQDQISDFATKLADFFLGAAQGFTQFAGMLLEGFGEIANQTMWAVGNSIKAAIAPLRWFLDLAEHLPGVLGGGVADALKDGLDKVNDSANQLAHVDIKQPLIDAGQAAQRFADTVFPELRNQIKMTNEDFKQTFKIADALEIKNVAMYLPIEKDATAENLNMQLNMEKTTAEQRAEIVQRLRALDFDVDFDVAEGIIRSIEGKTPEARAAIEKWLKIEDRIRIEIDTDQAAEDLKTGLDGTQVTLNADANLRITKALESLPPLITTLDTPVVPNASTFSGGYGGGAGGAPSGTFGGGGAAYTGPTAPYAGVLPGRNVTYDKQQVQAMGIAPIYQPGEYPYANSGNAFPQWVYDLGNKFNLPVSSSIGISGADSLHGAGNAFDLSGTAEDMERLAQAVLATPELLDKTLQLIYRTPSGVDYEVAGGQPAPGYYGGDTMQAHVNHVHLAFSGPVDLSKVFPAAGVPAGLPSAAGVTIPMPGGKSGVPVTTTSNTAPAPAAPATPTPAAPVVVPTPAPATPAPAPAPATPAPATPAATPAPAPAPTTTTTPSQTPVGTGLPANASPQQIADYIAKKAFAAGMSPQEAAAFIVQAWGESQLKSSAYGATTGDASGAAQGIYQFTPDTWRAFGQGGDMMNPQQNIDAYFRMFASPERSGSDVVNLPNGAIGSANDPEIIRRLAVVSVGGPAATLSNPGHWENAVQGAMPYLGGALNQENTTSGPKNFDTGPGQKQAGWWDSSGKWVDNPSKILSGSSEGHRALDRLADQVGSMSDLMALKATADYRKLTAEEQMQLREHAVAAAIAKTEKETADKNAATADKDAKTAELRRQTEEKFRIAEQQRTAREAANRAIGDKQLLTGLPLSEGQVAQKFGTAGLSAEDREARAAGAEYQERVDRYNQRGAQERDAVIGAISDFIKTGRENNPPGSSSYTTGKVPDSPPSAYPEVKKPASQTLEGGGGGGSWTSEGNAVIGGPSWWKNLGKKIKGWVWQGTEASGSSGYATGGSVFGAGGPTDDKIPAWLSNGEHVWTAAEVQAAGGHQNVLALRSNASKLPKFSEGGGVTDEYRSAAEAISALYGGSAQSAPVIGRADGELAPNTSTTTGLGLGPTPNVNAAPGFQRGQNLTDFASGFQATAQSNVEGTIYAITNPVETAKALAPLVGLGNEEAPLAFDLMRMGRAWRDLGKSVLHWDEWADNPYGAAGGLTLDIGSILLPGGTAKKLLGKADNVAGRGDDALTSWGQPIEYPPTKPRREYPPGTIIGPRVNPITGDTSAPAMGAMMGPFVSPLEKMAYRLAPELPTPRLGKDDVQARLAAGERITVPSGIKGGQSVDLTQLAHRLDPDVFMDFYDTAYATQRLLPGAMPALMTVRAGGQVLDWKPNTYGQARGRSGRGRNPKPGTTSPRHIEMNPGFSNDNSLAAYLSAFGARFPNADMIDLNYRLQGEIGWFPKFADEPSPGQHRRMPYGYTARRMTIERLVAHEVMHVWMGRLWDALEKKNAGRLGDFRDFDEQFRDVFQQLYPDIDIFTPDGADAYTAFKDAVHAEYSWKTYGPTDMVGHEMPTMAFEDILSNGPDAMLGSKVVFNRVVDLFRNHMETPGGKKLPVYLEQIDLDLDNPKFNEALGSDIRKAARPPEKYLVDLSERNTFTKGRQGELIEFLANGGRLDEFRPFDAEYQAYLDSAGDWGESWADVEPPFSQGAPTRSEAGLASRGLSTVAMADAARVGGKPATRFGPQREIQHDGLVQDILGFKSRADARGYMDTHFRYDADSGFFMPDGVEAIRQYSVGVPDINSLLRQAGEAAHPKHLAALESLAGKPGLLEGTSYRPSTRMQLADDIDAAMQRAKEAGYVLPHDLTLFRDVQPRAFSGQPWAGNAWDEKLHPGPEDVEELMGREFTDLGYMSTSVRARLGMDPTTPFTDMPFQLVINAPEGTSGLWLGAGGPRGFGNNDLFDEKKALSIFPAEDEWLLPRGSTVVPYDYKFHDANRPGMGASVYADLFVPPGFADGGAVFGAGGPTEDKVPAWLSDGEHVWTAAEVQAAGGHAAVAAMRGGVLPGFQDGGAVQVIDGVPYRVWDNGVKIPVEIYELGATQNLGYRSTIQGAVNPYVNPPQELANLPYKDMLAFFSGYTQWQQDMINLQEKGVDLAGQKVELERQAAQDMANWQTLMADAAAAEQTWNELPENQRILGYDNTASKEWMAYQSTKTAAEQARKTANASAEALDKLNRFGLPGYALERDRALLEGAPEPNKGKKGEGRGDKDAKDLGRGLVEGLLEGFGFSDDVFGESIFEWGIWKKFTQTLGWGLGNLQEAGLLGQPAQGNPLGAGTGLNILGGAAEATLPGAASNLPAVGGAGGVNGLLGLVPAGPAPGPAAADVTSHMAASGQPANIGNLASGVGTGPAPGPQTVQHNTFNTPTLGGMQTAIDITNSQAGGANVPAVTPY